VKMVEASPPQPAPDRDREEFAERLKNAKPGERVSLRPRSRKDFIARAAEHAKTAAKELQPLIDTTEAGQICRRQLLSWDAQRRFTNLGKTATEVIQ
jgi:hypothetical protein